MIGALRADDLEADGLDQFGRFHAPRTALHAGKTGQTGPNGLGSEQFVDPPLFHHGDELVRMIIHFLIGRACAGALAALHALARIHAADALDVFSHFFFFKAHASASFTPSASARSSVKYRTGTRSPTALTSRLY